MNSFSCRLKYNSLGFLKRETHYMPVKNVNSMNKIARRINVDTLSKLPQIDYDFCKFRHYRTWNG